MTIGRLVDGSRSPSLRAAARRAASVRALPGAGLVSIVSPAPSGVSSASFAFSDSLSTAARSSGPPAAAIATRADEQTTAAKIDQCCKRTNGAFPQSARGMTRP